MTRIGRQFHRRHHLVADDVDGVEVVRQPDEVLVVGKVALAAAVDAVMHIGRTGDQPEDQRIAAEMDLLVRIAAGQREGGWNRPQRLSHQAFVDPDGLVLAVDDGAGGGEQVHHPLAHDADAEFRQDAHRGVVQPLHPLFVEELHRRVGVFDMLPGQLRDAAAAAFEPRPAAPAAPVLRHRSLPLSAQ